MATMDIEVMREFKRIYSIVNNFVADMECEHLFNIDVEPHYIDGELIDVYIAVEEKDNHRILWATNADAFSSSLINSTDTILKELRRMFTAYAEWCEFWPDADYSNAVLILHRNSAEEVLYYVLKAIKIERKGVAPLLYQMISGLKREQALQAIKHFAKLHNLLIIEEAEEPEF